MKPDVSTILNDLAAIKARADQLASAVGSSDVATWRNAVSACAFGGFDDLLKKMSEDVAGLR